jgi:hypothetical protein
VGDSFNSWQGKLWDSLRLRVQTVSRGHPASYSMGIGVLTPVIKRSECEADHSPPSNVEVKNAWNYASTLPISPHGMVLS